MKEKLSDKIGVAGYIIWSIVEIILAFIPLYILWLPWYANLIAVIVIVCIPLLGDIAFFALWAITLPVAMAQSASVTVVLYFIGLVVYLGTTIVPIVIITIEGIRDR